MSENSVGDAVSGTIKDAEKKAEFWFNMVKFIGWPGVILIALYFAGSNAAKSLWPYAVKIFDTHIEVVAGLLEQQKVQSIRSEESNKIMEKISMNQIRITDNQIKIIDEITAGQAVHNKMLVEIHKAVVKDKE